MAPRVRTPTPTPTEVHSSPKPPLYIIGPDYSPTEEFDSDDPNVMVTVGIQASSRAVPEASGSQASSRAAPKASSSQASSRAVPPASSTPASSCAVPKASSTPASSRIVEAPSFPSQALGTATPKACVSKGKFYSGQEGGRRRYRKRSGRQVKEKAARAACRRFGEGGELKGPWEDPDDSPGYGDGGGRGLGGGGGEGEGRGGGGGGPVSA